MEKKHPPSSLMLERVNPMNAALRRPRREQEEARQVLIHTAWRGMACGRETTLRKTEYLSNGLMRGREDCVIPAFRGKEEP
ncbi:hypothetical protein EYF80_058745 [Liparis tanakae]|uniref:Uncharacterized protein n=1 Tax=Liparis tanakae TaxID=230148 RepID=A0A4Z2EQN4_9TELE|nr:hypothetical protein EYF80_058745 [Liparis tanakae]